MGSASIFKIKMTALLHKTRPDGVVSSDGGSCTPGCQPWIGQLAGRLLHLDLPVVSWAVLEGYCSFTVTIVIPEKVHLERISDRLKCITNAASFCY
jgi:hypothetical protein